MARPQKLTDGQIVALIAALRAENLPCTGVDIRRELARRFGVRAGTDRVYRLLRELALHTELPAARPTIDLAQLEIQRDAALRRAQLAEYREEATQVRTANEIDTLRQRLRALGVDPFGSDDYRGSRPFPT
jgi:hypothetical protein